MLAPFSALSAVVLIALICGSVVAQNAAAVVQAGPKLLAAIFLLHAGEAWLHCHANILGSTSRLLDERRSGVLLHFCATANLSCSSPPRHAVPCAGGFFFGYALSRAVGIPERAARTNSIEVRAGRRLLCCSGLMGVPPAIH